MESFLLEQLKGERALADKPYLEFLRAASMSLGLYEIPAGGLDGQSPHTEDEVYVVLEGRGRFVCSGQDLSVQPGAVIFVPALAEHRFHDVTEDLSVLVFFAPAETSNQPSK